MTGQTVRELSRHSRASVVAVGALGVLAAGLVLHLGRGDFSLTPVEVLRALAGVPSGADIAHRFVVVDLRLPRALTGALVGAALGLAGAITQMISRNPLASPDVLGVTAGAGTGAVTAIVLGGSAYGGSSGVLAAVGVPGAAIAGGLVAAVLVLLAGARRGIDGYRFVLAGVGIAALLTSVTSWLLTVGDVNDAGRALVWLTGSLHGRGWQHAVPLLIALAVLVPVTAGLGGTLGVLQFGDDTARALGVRLTAARTVLLVVAVALASVATAAAGPIAFVGLVAPQIALRLAGTSRPPSGGSALVGAALTVWADLAARTLLGVHELPVGVVTAVLGAPYLLYLLIRGSRRLT